MTDYIGQIIGQYRIEALLGTGGMGQVFRGVHKLLDRPAAIKVMQANFAARPDFRTRFLQEAKAAASLRHPNIVEIYDYGDQDGVLFLVMELMNDGALNALVRRSGGQLLPLPLALDLCGQVAEGLAAAHAMRVVHRDIKPANLLLRQLPSSVPGQEHYTVKINDFGLARLMEGGIETATGVPMGTLAYMSPEQCMGSRQIDGRSDLYSLGAVIYELVTGYQPFQITGITDALYKHVNVPPPPPRDIRPDLPPMLEEIILRCLAKKPEDRYATGTALAAALQGGLGNTAPTLAATQRQGGAVTQTTFEPLGQTSVAPTPPTVSTMPGFSDVPRVRVVDQGGNTLQVVEVTPQGITVGRQDGNDIVLRSQAVSRQHLRITWDGKQVRAQDLGSSNGTVLGDTRLMPQVSQAWQERQMIRLGSFWLRLEGASPLLTQLEQAPARLPGGNYSATTTPGAGTAYMLAGPPSLVNERIGLSVTHKTLSITPGQSVTVQLTLTNLGSTVDWFTPVVEGVPSEWVQGARQEVQLNPGMQETVSLLITVARHPANRAGEYPVVIQARSREMPQEYSLTNGVWIVQPFKEETLRLEPRRASGHGKASYTVALTNGGNAASRYQLSGEDDEQILDYQFRSNPVDLDGGREARVPLTVRGRRRFIGREQRLPFQLRAGQIGSPPSQVVPGEFVNKALLPRWIVPAFLALVLIAGGVLGVVSGLIPWLGSPTHPSVTVTAPPSTGIDTTSVSPGPNSAATATATSATATATSATATATSATATATSATATAQPMVTPSVTSFSQPAPGCGTTDSRISWSTNQATLQCQSSMTLLTKVGSWNGNESSRLGQLIMRLPNQAFPSQYHITVTILSLYDPAEQTYGAGANHGGCGGVTVHISNDGQTYDTIYVCNDGIYGYQPVVGGQGGTTQETNIAQSPTGQYVLNIFVNEQSITYTVSNSNGVSQTQNIQTTSAFSSAISLDQAWRNDGATAGFENFSFSTS